MNSPDQPKADGDQTSVTSPSLALALAVGCLARLNPNLSRINVWDPTSGIGYAGGLLVEALRSAGRHVSYRGQDISDTAISAARQRFADVQDAEFVVADTLTDDPFERFEADLVIVDPPWGVNWTSAAQKVEKRHREGAFKFGLPPVTDGIWLFISLALEKLRPAPEGGGRVAALVNPAALSVHTKSADVRRNILEAGLLESVTRLPDGLAPGTIIPLYLITLSNQRDNLARQDAMIADLQTQFATVNRRRTIQQGALEELESGLRTRKPGPRNRFVGLNQFVSRTAKVSRTSSDGRRLSWRITAYNDTPINTRFLDARYGEGSGVRIDGEPHESIDLNPSRIFERADRELLDEMEKKGWPARRLSGLLRAAPEALKEPPENVSHDGLLIPIAEHGQVSSEPSDDGLEGRIIALRIEDHLAERDFLVAWLNSERGISNRRRALTAGASGHFMTGVGSDTNSLMRWADELIIPVPELSVQSPIASADKHLASFQAELKRHRERLWDTPDQAEDIVSKFSQTFDDSLDTWWERLPFPVAMAFRTADVAKTPFEKLEGYLRAWEAFATFHATVLLSAIRRDPETSRETEDAIRLASAHHGGGIERATFGTWVAIMEKTSKNLRNALTQGDADDIARVRESFAGLPLPWLERLVSKDVVQAFAQVRDKRNRWLGHSGYTSPDERTEQVNSLVLDLRELRQLLGDVWAQLPLVRAGSAKIKPDGCYQTAEVAVGTSSPFRNGDFKVGQAMLDGELYLVRDEAQTPLRLARFVQLRAAPSDAQYTSYFYNRTEGDHVRMVTYQYGPGTELEDDVADYREEFGALIEERD